MVEREYASGGRRLLWRCPVLGRGGSAKQKDDTVRHAYLGVNVQGDVGSTWTGHELKLAREVVVFEFRDWVGRN